ncbi:MAG TPA: Crp/Fnr family transcriptional regulator [Thermoanaerobaculia bacterium]
MTDRENLLLEKLPSDVLQRLRPELEPVHLPLSLRLMEDEQALEYAYFPRDSVISLVRVFTNGTAVEVGMIGYEAFLGMHALLGINVQPAAAIVQMEGEAWRVPIGRVVDLYESRPDVRAVFGRAIHYLTTQISQTAACNRTHTPEERLARWLLQIHDRVIGDTMMVTQEFLSIMLATRRASINEAVAHLRDVGAIAHRRQRITVTNRELLESRACECYGTLTREGIRTLDFAPRAKAEPELADVVT